MPPHRLVLFLAVAVGLPTLMTFFSLLHSHPRDKLATEDEPESSRSGITAFFSFHTPSTLFPPSAIISLTDDNSTFFLARPADFGPLLASNGLSGELWIGSGFGQDDLGRSGAGAGAEGELGCSDVPGWDDGNQKYSSPSSRELAEPKYAFEKANLDSHTGKLKGSRTSVSENGLTEPSRGDGTDDHLHHPLPSSPVSKPSKPGQSAQHESDPKGHADIQSLQESAEITGKIALLTRGGCGFLEKVKWAQRRGATGVIISDHTRGGALVTMYARGDTSNITIPSLFTSHTTAHLLSSLVPPNDADDIVESHGETEEPGQPGEGLKDKTHDYSDNDRPTFTPESRPKATPASKTSTARGRSMAAKFPLTTKPKTKSSWLSPLRDFFSISRYLEDKELPSDSRRPPSSGRLDWFSEKQNSEKRKESRSATKSIASAKNTPTSKEAFKSGSHLSSSDDFVIGVQDWRDPDLVIGKPVDLKSTTQSSSPVPLATQALLGKLGKEALSELSSGNTLAGGSITPGSGEYLKPGQWNEQQRSSDKAKKKGVSKSFSTDSAVDGSPSGSHNHPDVDKQHEGLWVTLTPTTMSTSPFFDTLLVLVVSPLVTLTVVYALLLLRSRIRRRRWRAPKSVVDRLPIRTYHTMSCSSTASSTRLASPQSSSPTSPLLQSSPRSTTHRSRPRSATTSGIGETAAASLDRDMSKVSKNQNEKGHVSSPKKRRKYHGRQVECVVCLEEYMDGHSRVMSLPCGHEFHADCM